MTHGEGRVFYEGRVFFVKNCPELVSVWGLGHGVNIHEGSQGRWSSVEPPTFVKGT